MGYRQLTQAQRYQISALLTVGRSQRKIGETLVRHNTTISRKKRRNGGATGYAPDRPSIGVSTVAEKPARPISGLRH